MSKFNFWMVGLVVLFACSACNNNEPSVTKTCNPYNANVQGTLVKCSRPTDWQVVAQTSYSSMCVIVDDYGIPTAVDTADIIAAFIRNECRGVVTPVYDQDAQYWRFNMAVNATDADAQESSVQVEIRYYSAKNEGMYTAQTFPYEEGAPKGAYGKGNGFVPAWK